MVITGQSFMLNQIRKMVGVAVAIMRGLAPEDAISLALEPRRDVNTCIAPDVGLFLDESIFDSYNSKWGYNRNECVSQEAYREEIDAFKVMLPVLYHPPFPWISSVSTMSFFFRGTVK